MGADRVERRMSHIAGTRRSSDLRCANHDKATVRASLLASGRSICLRCPEVAEKLPFNVFDTSAIRP